MLRNVREILSCAYIATITVEVTGRVGLDCTVAKET